MTYNYEMTMKFKLASQDEPLDSRFATALCNIFRDYEDGRYPFDVEQVQHGLSDCMKHAASDAIRVRLWELDGDEVVESEDGKGFTSRWYLEAQNTTPVVPHFHEEPTVSIERVSDDEAERPGTIAMSGDLANAIIDMDDHGYSESLGPETKRSNDAWEELLLVAERVASRKSNKRD